MRMRKPKDMEEMLETCDFYLDENLFNNNNNNPINIEIGMGKGDFILNMALNFPNINFIGIEKYSNVASVAIKKIKEIKPNNLKILIMDALNIPEYLNGKINTIFLNFSDPWPKDRHAKRRLTHENYLKKYDTLFKEKNTIILKTDNDSFYEFSKNSMLDYGYIILNESLDLHNTDIFNIETEYEKKFSSMGIKIKYLKVEKNNK